MKNYSSLKIPSILNILIGILMTIGENPLGPIFFALGATFGIIEISKAKKHDRRFYSIIIAIAFLIMLIGEYFIVNVRNTMFYVLLLIMSIGIFLAVYFSLVPQNQLTKGEKSLGWIGAIIFSISLFILMGFIFNNFIITLILGIVIVITTISK